ncbi:NRAMP family divalent metal transporter [Wansuia hejianensis]|uniref:Divalent metal cation transporter n=1 Tax=Wansuia hejianensis TaxID=2763667 RepID=A0A926EX38_9FIRM|nr:divalent metal cation transporter [Wansuia hejianensis]MBC8590090.1 divalent metal cation transporter [Wansuia hejianensis]
MERKVGSSANKPGLFKKMISIIGPGLITAAIVMGPGSITVSSKIGASMGYSALWAVLAAAIMMTAFSKMGTTIGIVSQESLLQTVRNKYGNLLSLIIGLGGFFIIAGFQTGNNIGAGLAFSTVFGGSVGMWAGIFTVIALVFMWGFKDMYGYLEKLMTFLVFIMIITFVGNVFYIRPNLGEVARGFVPSKPENMGLIISISGTSFSVAAAAFQAYSVKAKGWKLDDLNEGLKSSYVGTTILAIITMVIMITAATVLKPAGIEVTSAIDMATQLEPLLGSLAKWLFLLGFWSAAFSSFIGNAMIGGTLLADGLGIGNSMESKWSKIFASFVMILGTLAAILFGQNPIQLLILAQGTTMLAVPIIAIVMLILANDKELMGKHKNSLLLNVVGVISVVWLLYLSFNQLMQFIGK